MSIKRIIRKHISIAKNNNITKKKQIENIKQVYKVHSVMYSGHEQKFYI